MHAVLSYCQLAIADSHAGTPMQLQLLPENAARDDCITNNAPGRPASGSLVAHLLCVHESRLGKRLVWAGLPAAPQGSQGCKACEGQQATHFTESAAQFKPQIL
jgi:hypothetical protein